MHNYLWTPKMLKTLTVLKMIFIWSWQQNKFELDGLNTTMTMSSFSFWQWRHFDLDNRIFLTLTTARPQSWHHTESDNDTILILKKVLTLKMAPLWPWKYLSDLATSACCSSSTTSGKQLIISRWISTDVIVRISSILDVNSCQMKAKYTCIICLKKILHFALLPALSTISIRH